MVTQHGYWHLNMADKIVTSINQIQRGMFVKFTDRDKNGKFSYVGEVIDLNLGKETKVGMDKDIAMIGANFTMITTEGVMGFDMEKPTANELSITTTKPAGWAKFKKDPVKFKSSEVKKNVVVLETKTKREQVAELVASNTRKKESALLKLAKIEVGGNETQLLNYIKLELSKK